MDLIVLCKFSPHTRLYPPLCLYLPLPTFTHLYPSLPALIRVHPFASVSTLFHPRLFSYSRTSRLAAIRVHPPPLFTSLMWQAFMMEMLDKDPEKRLDVDGVIEGALSV